MSHEPLLEVASAGGTAAPAPGSAARWVRALAGGVAEARSFRIRRAEAELRAAPASNEGVVLARVLQSVADEDVDRDERVGALLQWAGFLESRGRLDEAADILELARLESPSDAGLTLHAARVARKSGRSDDARALYRRVRVLDGENGSLGAMARVGEALLDPDPRQALGRALREAVRSGDREAAAVAQEERFRARRTAGDLRGALRDGLVAAARYRDSVDRGRVGHELADLLLGAGDLLGARRILLEVEARAHPDQAAWARSRLRDLSRRLGDEIGRRRWRDAPLPALISLTPAPRSRPDPAPRVPRLGRWLDRLDGEAPAS
jgi:tetratricopeptide (TPR) repeat protein